MNPEDMAVKFADEHFDKFLKDSNLWDAMYSAFMAGYNSSNSDKMYNWLWNYREELKSTNVFHKNEAIISSINKVIDK